MDSKRKWIILNYSPYKLDGIKKSQNNFIALGEALKSLMRLSGHECSR